MLRRMPFLLHHALVTAKGASPERWALVIHGILGSGTNLRSLARRLADARPEWGFVLPDLRMHGLSQGAPPPHSLASAAADLAALERALGLSIAAAIGHSYGGKTAMAYAAGRREPLDSLWILDASPSARPDRRRDGPTARVLDMLAEVPWPLPSRERFFAIVAEHGLSRGIGEWLAMNVRREEDGFRFRLDLAAIGALLDDYFAVDLWPAVEDPRVAREVHVVAGGRSEAVGAADRARLVGLAPRVRTHVLEGAGHWVHVDAPDALAALLIDGL
jgi:esterase